jgi:diphosphomevalonate decarboxylase
MKTWTATAPSNIALVKYMGKVDPGADAGAKNVPTNTSLSFTLPHLLSYVQIEHDPSLAKDVWEPLVAYEGKTFERLALSEKGAARFLAHLQFLKNQFGFDGFFKVRSANRFPSDCGLASSASSFAALTKAAFEALSSLTGRPLPSVQEAANASRLGSGSSCRSFFAPWSIWVSETVADVPELKSFGDLLHQVVVVDERVKAVSSSEAHKRVTTSALFAGRPERADRRALEFIAALRKDEWREAFEIAWAEFWDMHALFETSKPSFGYMTGGSLEVLNFVRDRFWTGDGTGPLVTMDAGPNVHLLYRNDDRGRAQAHQLEHFAKGRFKVFSSGAGLSGVD